MTKPTDLPVALCPELLHFHRVFGNTGSLLTSTICLLNLIN